MQFESAEVVSVMTTLEATGMHDALCDAMRSAAAMLKRLQADAAWNSEHLRLGPVFV